MSVDSKTAKHICNVVRRQIQEGYPKLFINFIIHEEDSREKTFLREVENIRELPAGDSLVEFMQKDINRQVLTDNRSCFVALAHHRNPGFLGFFKNESLLALSFINHERFENKSSLRNHAYHLAWHAIALYLDFIDRKPQSSGSLKKENFEFENEVITPALSSKELSHRNLKADIFSASVQKLYGKENALEVLAKQRMTDTLSAETGFRAERFPFPICLETLEFVFENNFEQYARNKQPVLASTNIVNDIGKTYEPHLMEQWRVFGEPAQEMAWNGHSPETILGAALYTGESTYAQSISDMLCERLDIRPETITTLHDYNPFTDSQANERIHKKQCHDLIEGLLSRVQKKEDYIIFADVIKKQSQTLLDKSIMGWCSHALIESMKIIEQSIDNEHPLKDTLQAAREVFYEQQSNIPWETLVFFTNSLFESRRAAKIKTLEDIIKLTETQEEFSTIHSALLEALEIEKNPKYSKKNISDFMSANAIKS